MDSAKVGRTIALLRKKYGMTQLELAECLSVTDKAVSRWERGLGTPDTSLLVKLSLILDIDVESLLEGNATFDEIGWKGILILEYPDGILPTDLVFTKRIVYLQLCYFLLAGITDVLVVGKRFDVEIVKNHICKESGMTINFEVTDLGIDANKIVEYGCNDSLMVLSGFDLIYGKDFTKYMRRIMNNCKKPTRLYDFEKKETSFLFFPRGTIADKDIQMFSLERGVVHIPIQSRGDLADASTLLQIIESHQEEPVMDVHQIVERRHIKDK